MAGGKASSVDQDEGGISGLIQGISCRETFPDTRHTGVSTTWADQREWLFGFSREIIQLDRSRAGCCRISSGLQTGKTWYSARLFNKACKPSAKLPPIRKWAAGA